MILLLLLSLSLAGSTAAAEPTPSELLAQGSSQRAYGRLEQSVLSLQKLLKRNPESPRGWYELGLTYAAQGRFREAADAYRLSLSKNPDSGACHCAHALALRELRQIQSGLGEAQACLRALPAYAGGWNLKGNFLHDLGRLEEARQAYARAVELSPNYGNAAYNLGLTLQDLGREAEAAAAFERAVTANPRLHEAWNSLGNLRLRKGQASRARDAFRRSLESEPGNPDGHWGMARSLRAMGRAQQAGLEEEAYRRAVRSLDRAAQPGLSAAVAPPEEEAWKHD